MRLALRAERFLFGSYALKQVDFVILKAFYENGTFYFNI